MKYYFRKLAIFIVCILFISGCAGMISTSTQYGAGIFGEYDLPEPKSEKIYVPMNFSLKTVEKEGLKKKISEITNQQIKEFVSIGVRAISEKYGFETSGWAVNIEKVSVPEPKEDPMLVTSLGLDSSPIYFDPKIKINFKSGLSKKLNIETSTLYQNSLIKTDTKSSKNKSYKAQFSGSAIITLRSSDKDLIYFDLDIYVTLQRKSKFADDKHFAIIDTFNGSEIDKVRDILGRLIFEAYFQTLNARGIKVSKG